MKNHDIIEIEGKVHHETDAAYFFSAIDKENKVWLPKSQCEWNYDLMNQSEGLMQLPEWLALEKGLL